MNEDISKFTKVEKLRDDEFPGNLAELYQLRAIIEAKLGRLNAAIAQAQNQQAGWPNPSDVSFETQVSKGRGITIRKTGVTPRNHLAAISRS